MSKHRCFEVTTPAGHAARINGDPRMAQETLEALMRMIDLAYEQSSVIEAAVCPKGGSHVWGIDGAHNNEYCKKCFMARPKDEGAR